jgi:hypothetical protein
MATPVAVAPSTAAPAEVVAPEPRHAHSLLRRLTRRSTWPAWANLVAILGVTLVALSQLQPSLLVTATTTAGGDTGAHVTLAQFLRSDLLPHGQLTGWDPGWYDGFPLYTFYFPLPGMLTVALNAFITYDVAFKLVTVLGTLLLPVCAWAFGKLAGLRDPGPACLAAATLPFLFEPSFTIYGGNIFSTLAGEYSFSLSLSVALVFLGLVASGLRTGRHRALAAVLFAITLLCHLLPALFAVAGAVVWLVLDADLLRAVRRGPFARKARRRWSRRLGWLAVVGAIGAGLCAWWLVPFAVYQPYTTDMGYTKVLGFPHLLFPGSARWVLVADLVGIVAMVLRRNRVALFLVVMGALSAAAVCLDPANKLYNARFLPFWFLCLYLLAGYALAEVVAALARWNRRRRLAGWVDELRRRLEVVDPASWRPGMRIARVRRPVASNPPGALAGPLVALFAACLVVVPPMVLPASTLSQVGVTVGAAQPNEWAAWNYSGYERKPDYPEYKAVVDMMKKVGANDGCGRTMWEYDPNLNRFGTTMALMLLPYWTNGCVDSEEGLLFESASTTPFHFIDQDELSPNPSEAITSPAITYSGLDVPLGIEHLQLLGVRYLLASSPTVEQAAAADPNATEVGKTGPWTTVYNGQTLVTTWKVYRIADSSLVQPLTHQPVVWTGVSTSQASWLAPAVSWYDQPARWDVVPSAGGPPGWQRVRASDTTPAAVPEPATKVTEVHQSGSSVSFHVDRTGTPVEVRVSYFPNWQASGAEGPWRVAPNLMVVVPTSHDVTLHYGTTSVDRLGQLATVVAAAAAVWLAVRGWRKRRRGRSPTAVAARR